MEQIDYLVGPISVYYFKSKKEAGFNKRIYIFGDFHIKKSICPPIDQTKSIIYFDTMLDMTLNYNKDKIIDVFDEAPYISKEFYDVKELQDSYPSYVCLFGSFGNCYIPHFIKKATKQGCDINKIKKDALEEYERSCPYKNIRYHAADPRLLMEYSNNSFRELSNIVNEFYSDDEIDINIDIQKWRNYLFEKVLYIETICNFPKIKKQLDFVEANLRKKIIIYLINRLIKIRRSFYFEKRNVESIVNVYMKFGCLATDAYTLGRLFKIKVDPPYEAKNIIVMNGQSHVDNYINFFYNSGLFDCKFNVKQKNARRLLNKIRENKNKKNKLFQCLDIRKLKFPLFQDGE